MLDVRRLALLRELAQRGTVTATAAAVHLTGPAVSQQLAVLEREAGAALLERTGRTLTLTAAGRLLVQHADVVLAGVAAAEAALAALAGGAGATVRIAAFPSAARTLVAAIWTRLGEVSLRLVEHEPIPAIAALTGREVDLALVHTYSLAPRDLPSCDAHHLSSEPAVLAVPAAVAAAHRLQPGQPARLGEFADLDWLVPGSETPCREMIERACGAAGFVPRTVAVASDFTVLLALVGAGAGATLVPTLALPPATPGASLHPLRQPVTRTINVLARSGESGRPELRTVIDALRAAV